MKSLCVLIVIFLLSVHNSYGSKTKTTQKISYNLGDKKFTDENSNVNEIMSLVNRMSSDSENEKALDNFTTAEISQNLSSATPSKINNKKTKKKTQRKWLKNLPYDKEQTKIDNLLQNWLTINSEDFGNGNKYPPVEGRYLNIDDKYNRINEKFINKKVTKEIPSKYYFWFKHSEKYIHYYHDKGEANALGAIYIDSLVDARDILNSKCFNIIEFSTTKFRLCAQKVSIKKKWLCSIQNHLKVVKDKICGGPGLEETGANAGKIKTKTIVQPMILIPMASEHCNQNWNYQKNGADWQCKCIEGNNQSPINLPPHNKAINSLSSPVFLYEDVNVQADSPTSNGLIKEGDNHKIFFRDGALRIFATGLGKIVTLDGTGYYADEIVFHTPSEHLINGKPADMEMKIIHKAQTEGDFGKMLTLSFLFKKKAGSYNKFLDKLDFFNLPNPADIVQELKENIFIPNVLIDEDIEGSGDMLPFSFYTYHGSTSEPPCNENTIVMVAAEPIPASISSLTLFREALSLPDQIDYAGRIIPSKKNLSNVRMVQPTNGRAIFYYDKKYNCNNFKRIKNNDPPVKSHYERVTNIQKKYYFVEGEKPSMMPGAYVVTDTEAKGMSKP